MPKRSSEIKNPAEIKEVTYEELLDTAITHIEEKYESILKFVQGEDFVKAGFSSDQSQVNSFLTYMSRTKEGRKPVKSIPTMIKLYKFFFGAKVVSKVKVERSLVITLNKPKILRKK